MLNLSTPLQRLPEAGGGYRREVTVVEVPRGSQWTLTLSDVPNPCAPIPVGSAGVRHGGFAA